MRLGYLDALRGLAVVWMIIFHTAYDLKILGLVSWDFSQGFWWIFPRLIAGTFLFCVGASVHYAHFKATNWHELKARALKLAVSAALVSGVTYVIFPGQWIYFGTLHCILVGSILAALLVRRRQLAAVMMIGIMALQYGVGLDIQWVSNRLDRPSMDFIPIYPWFWVILLGMLLAPYLAQVKALKLFSPPQWLRLLGTHSLKIYLLHQPIIFGILWALV
jgi:uncharacterized membrane protein